VIPELLQGTSHGFPKRVNQCLCIRTNFFGSCPRNEPRAFAWAARNDRIRLVEPREWNAPGSHDGFACEHSGGIGEGFQPGIEIGVELARNSVQRQEGFVQEEKVERHWMALQSQLLHDLERGVQWIASALRQRNPDGLPITLE
jgi:hypothetical protein